LSGPLKSRRKQVEGVPPNLEDVAREVEAQPAALSGSLERKIGRAAPGSLFVGAGDSYACALAAQHLSEGMVLALDPYSLLASEGFAKGREVYFISVSGRTRSNIAAARVTRRVAARTFTITSEPESPLAKATDETLELPYSYIPRMPGTLSFALSLLTTIKLSCGPISCNFSRLFSDARESTKALFSESGTTYFLGNGPIHAVSLYSSLKVFEVLGSKSAAELLEEFGHAILFSLRTGDAVDIYGAFDPAKVGKRLASSLRLEGFNSRLLPDSGRNKFESVFYAAFLSQLSVLKEARSRRLESPHLVNAERGLKLSDSMIY